MNETPPPENTPRQSAATRRAIRISRMAGAVAIGMALLVVTLFGLMVLGQ